MPLRLANRVAVRVLTKSIVTGVRMVSPGAHLGSVAFAETVFAVCDCTWKATKNWASANQPYSFSWLSRKHEAKQWTVEENEGRGEIIIEDVRWFSEDKCIGYGTSRKRSLHAHDQIDSALENGRASCLFPSISADLGKYSRGAFLPWSV